MSVTFTFQKKHFLMLGLVIAIPFLILSIVNIMAVVPGGQYHLFSELFVDQDIDMNGYNITQVGFIKAIDYCDETGNNCMIENNVGGGSPVDWDCEYIIGPASRYPVTTQALCSEGYVLVSGGGSTTNCDEYLQGIVGGSSRSGWWVRNQEGSGNTVTPFALCCK